MMTSSPCPIARLMMCLGQRFRRTAYNLEYMHHMGDVAEFEDHSDGRSHNAFCLDQMCRCVDGDVDVREGGDEGEGERREGRQRRGRRRHVDV